jgi:hypothetical protein
MREQAEAAGGDRNRESNDERGQAERLIGGRGLRKEITAEQSEEHAAHGKDEEPCAVTVSDKVSERDAWRDWNEVGKEEDCSEKKKKSNRDRAA